MLQGGGRGREPPFFFFNDTATTEIYTLSLHDALPISTTRPSTSASRNGRTTISGSPTAESIAAPAASSTTISRSEEHTSELQSRQYLVCRLLLEKKHPATPLNSYTVRPIYATFRRLLA